MEKQILEIERESLEEGRAEAKAKTPPGLFILSEKVLADGKQRTVEGLAETADEAAVQARGKVPADTKVIGEKVKTAAERRTLDVEAWDQASAEEKIKKEISGTSRVEGIEIKVPGRKGVLGIGKTPNTYSAAVFQPAIFEVAYKGKARIRVEIGERTHAPAGHCQCCGTANAPAKVSEKNVHYFCSSGCSERYFKSKLSTLMFGRSTFIMNASGQDISGMLAVGRDAADRATAYCWSCGRNIPMSDKKCPSCGKEQDIPA
jgi:hypothetical protein